MRFYKETLLNQVQKIDGLAAVETMAGLNDMIEYGQWSEQSAKTLLSLLLDHYFNHEPEDEQLKRPLQKTLNKFTLLNEYPLNEEDFKPLINRLKQSQNVPEICQGLNMLSRTFQPEFIPFIETFVSHQNEIISERAKEALELIKSRS